MAESESWNQASGSLLLIIKSRFPHSYHDLNELINMVVAVMVVVMRMIMMVMMMYTPSFSEAEED